MTRASPPDTAGRPRPRRSWQRVVGTLGAVLLGAVLLFAAFWKAIDPLAFAEQVRHEGLGFGLPAGLVAMTGLGVEVAIGTLLLLGVRRWWVLVPASLLTLFFLVLTGRTWFTAAHGGSGSSGSCGCFGNLFDHTPAEAFWRDVALLVPPLLAAWFLGRSPAGARWPRVRVGLAALATAGVLVLAAWAPDLPFDDLATRLAPGTRVADTCAGRGVHRICLTSAPVLPEIATGEHVVVLADLDDPALVDAIPALNDLVLAEGAPPLWLVCTSGEEARTAFFWAQGPAFEIREAPWALLRPLYRRLPRSFRVRDGVVVETWDGFPPAAPPADG